MPGVSLQRRGIFKLPLELFPIIFEYLVGDHRTLVALTTTTKSLAFEAKKSLYQDVTHWPTNRRRHSQFLSTIILSPDLGLYVRSYSIRVVSTDLDPFFNLLHRGLKVMNNLHQLTIEDAVVSYYKPNPHLTQILTGTNFKLRAFAWICRTDENPIAAFLSTQTELEELNICWHSEWRKRILPDMCADVPPSVCPRLRRLCGEVGTLKMFLPGRNIDHLSCPPPSGTQIGEIEDTLPLLSTELGKIKTLCCSIYYAGSFLYSYLGRLEVLHLVGFLVEENVERITLLPNIRIVILQGRSILSAEITETEFKLDDIPYKLFYRCKRLERLDILCRPECKEPEKRWSRWIKDVEHNEGFSLLPIHTNDAILNSPYQWVKNTGF
ncbi:hypothetical protein BJ165DRAFT_1451786 [Panaeolus papilionaceus]|nr:hypothetical protein BJ165DRAFT_1451786 [Panaeolus papilionaceus]